MQNGFAVTQNHVVVTVIIYSNAYLGRLLSCSVPLQNPHIVFGPIRLFVDCGFSVALRLVDVSLQTSHRILTHPTVCRLWCFSSFDLRMTEPVEQA